MKRLSLLILLLVIFSTQAQTQYSEIIKQELKEKILPKSSKTPIYTTLFEELSKADLACDNSWTQISSKEEYNTYRDKIRKNLIEAIGGFPKRTPLNAKIVQKIKRKNYIIEKIHFQSRPGLYVTGLLFLPNPDKFKAPYPGRIVIPAAHAIAANPVKINNILTVQNAPLSWEAAIKHQQAILLPTLLMEL